MRQNCAASHQVLRWHSRSAADPATRKAAEATNKRMDELHARGELNSSELDVLYLSIWPRVRSAAEDFELFSPF